MKMNTINPLSIILDTDGVILDFDKGYISAGQYLFDKEIKEVKKSWSLTEKYNLTVEEDNKIWDYFAKGGWKNLPLIPGADEAFHELKSLGFSIHVVTGIRPEHSDMRLQNFSKYDLTPDSIDCVGHGSSSKTFAIQKYKPIALVDDRLQHINENLYVPNRCWIDLNDEQKENKLCTKNATFISATLKHFVDECKNLLVEPFKTAI